MMFKSDAALIRHYFKELLSDGKEHTIHEVLAYILRRNGDMGVNGKSICYAKVQNSLYQFMRSGTSGYAMARRGSYIKDKALAAKQSIQSATFNAQAVTLDPVCDNALHILSAAEIGIRNCFMSYLSIMEISGKVGSSLRDTEKAVTSLLEQAMHKIKDLKTYQNHNYFAHYNSDCEQADISEA